MRHAKTLLHEVAVLATVWKFEVRRQLEREAQEQYECIQNDTLYGRQVRGGQVARAGEQHCQELFGQRIHNARLVELPAWVRGDAAVEPLLEEAVEGEEVARVVQAIVGDAHEALSFGLFSRIDLIVACLVNFWDALGDRAAFVVHDALLLRRATGGGAGARDRDGRGGVSERDPNGCMSHRYTQIAAAPSTNT